MEGPREAWIHEPLNIGVTQYSRGSKYEIPDVLNIHEH